MRRAEIALDAVESFAIEQQLAQGTGIPTNPFFGDGRMLLYQRERRRSQQSNGLAWLEEAIGATGKQGMIHATPGVVSHWFSNQREDRAKVLNDSLPGNGQRQQGRLWWWLFRGHAKRRWSCRRRAVLGVRNRPGRSPALGTVAIPGHLRGARPLQQRCHVPRGAVRARYLGLADPHAAVLIDWSP